MRLDDITSIIQWETHNTPHPWSMTQWESHLTNPYTAWVLRHHESDVLLGYGVLMHTPDEAELLTITITPPYRRQGWGLCLLKQLMQQAQHQGAQQLWLEVRVGNQPAIKMYHQVGFQTIRCRKAYYPHLEQPQHREDAWVMCYDF